MLLRLTLVLLCCHVCRNDSVKSSEHDSSIKDQRTSETGELGGNDEPVKLLSVKVKENIRIPSFSEIEVEVCVNGCTQNLSNCYVLENDLKIQSYLWQEPRRMGYLDKPSPRKYPKTSGYIDFVP